MRANAVLRQGAAALGARPQGPTTPYSAAHKAYVQSLYRRYLRNELDWCIRRDVWRDRAIEIRAEFERNRNVGNPRHLAGILREAEEALRERRHPDPYRRTSHTAHISCQRRKEADLNTIFHDLQLLMPKTVQNGS